MEHTAVDKSYDSKTARIITRNRLGNIAHIESRGDEFKDIMRSRRKKARRWVVELTHG